MALRLPGLHMPVCVPRKGAYNAAFSAQQGRRNRHAGLKLPK